MAGKVYLVGAGPGDARLITIKGKECIEKRMSWCMTDWLVLGC